MLFWHTRDWQKNFIILINYTRIIEFTFWTPGGSRKAPVVCLSVHLSGHFRRTGSLVFSKFWRGVSCAWQGRFFGEIFFDSKTGKIGLIFEKKLVPEILAKIVAANQIVQIFISAISPERIDEIAWYFACWYKFMKIKSLLKLFWVGMVLKLAVSPE